MTADPSLIARLDGVVVRHADRGPIGPVDLDVRRGEIVALVGASGCGKSTLLRLLAGLETPDAGRVDRYVDKGRTGLVFQNATLMPWAAAIDNVALPLRLSGQPGDRAHARARAVLAQVGLGDRAAARPHQLSGGMAMRASLARALVTDPDLLLLDEPFAALDSATRRALIEDIHGLWARTRPAIVFVTHDVEEAAYMAGRVLVMRAADGRIAAGVTTPGALPRPGGHRLDPAHARCVEQIATALDSAMEPAA
ncbi:MAG: ABC transporter ATP-binding protein [Brevundimonas sp.]|uniref:ABC transporter ATP-binding protein n=1 Tax=Brevundimonas sp. TaxID=1871086 RepID=UPI00391D1D62